MRKRLIVIAAWLAVAFAALLAALRYRAGLYRTFCDDAGGETVLACAREWQGLTAAILAFLIGLGILRALSRQAKLLRQQQLHIRRHFADHLRQMTAADRVIVLRESVRTEERLEKAIERIAAFEKDVETDPDVQNNPVQALRTRLAALEAIVSGERIVELKDYLSEDENRNVRELQAELRVQSSLLSKVLPKFETALSTLKSDSQEHRRMMRQVFGEMQNLHLSKQETVLDRARMLLENLRDLRSRWQNAWYMSDTDT